MPFVSITRLRVRHWRLLPQFLIQSIRIARQAQRAAGSIAVSVRHRSGFLDPDRMAEVAMRAFMQSGVHRRVMPRVPQWCDEATIVQITDRCWANCGVMVTLDGS